MDNVDYIDALSGSNLQKEIYLQTRIELWGEGFSWFDYKGWNKGFTRKGINEGGNAHAAIATNVTATGHNNWTWEIPKAETDYNSGINN